MKFKRALEILYKLEFNNPQNALHKNPTESGYTFMGIYETAHLGMVTVIYGMRGMLKMVLQIIGNKFKFKKDKEPK